MPKTKARKQKVSTSSKASELGEIIEEVDTQEGSKVNTCLEQFEMEFAFRLKQFDQLLEEKLVVLNRTKERLKIKYSTMLASPLEANDLMELIHGKENVSVTRMQSAEKYAQTENVISSLQGPHGKQMTQSSKEKNKERPLVPYSGNTFQTPTISTGIPGLHTITPKVAMNTPVSMLRLPRQGELALSLSGSPVMVTAMSHESKPNLNIPLNGEQVLTLVPHERLDPNSLPELDDEAVQQLELLNKHLLTFLNLTSSNSAFK